MSQMSVTLRTARTIALLAIAALITAATAVAFAESFRGLLEWAARHGLPGWWAAIWPLMVDVFVATGELSLFVSVLDRWDRRSRSGAWAITLAGLAASVGGNVGHLPHADWLTRLTGSVPPIAAASALAVGLGVLKRVVRNTAQETLESVPEDAPQESRQDAPRSLPESPASEPQETSQSVPEPVSRTAAKTSPGVSRKPSPAAAKKMSPSDLAPYARTLLENDPGLSSARLAKHLHVGWEKADQALKMARRDRLQAVAK